LKGAFGQHSEKRSGTILNPNVDSYIKTRNQRKTLPKRTKTSTKKRTYQQFRRRIVTFNLSGERFASLPPSVTPLVSVVL